MDSRTQHTDVDPRMSLAMWLRAGRAQRKLSLEDVARITKIQTRILEKIENGQLDGLPAEVFVRGFVRSFAKCVGLDESEALNRLGAAMPLVGTPSANAKAFVETMADLAPATARSIGTRVEQSLPIIVTPPPIETRVIVPIEAPVAAVEVAALEVAALEVTAAPAIETPTSDAAVDPIAAVALEAPKKKRASRKKTPSAAPRTRKKKSTAQTSLDAQGIVDESDSSESGSMAIAAGDSSELSAASDSSGSMAIAASDSSELSAASDSSASMPITSSDSIKRSRSSDSIKRSAASDSSGSMLSAASDSSVLIASSDSIKRSTASDSNPTTDSNELSTSIAASDPERPIAARASFAASESFAASAAMTSIDTGPIARIDAESIGVSSIEAKSGDSSLDNDGAVEAPTLAEGSARISASTIEAELAEPSTGTWQPTMPPISTTPSAPWRRPNVASSTAYVVPTLVIDDADPDSADRERDERSAKEPHRLSFLPPILLDREDRSARQGGLTLAVIILLIAATLTLSYLMRRPSPAGDGVTMLDGTSSLVS